MKRLLTIMCILIGMIFMLQGCTDGELIFTNSYYTPYYHPYIHNRHILTPGPIPPPSRPIIIGHRSFGPVQSRFPIGGNRGGRVNPGRR